MAGRRAPRIRHVERGRGHHLGLPDVERPLARFAPSPGSLRLWEPQAVFAKPLVSTMREGEDMPRLRWPEEARLFEVLRLPRRRRLANVRLRKALQQLRIQPVLRVRIHRPRPRRPVPPVRLTRHLSPHARPSRQRCGRIHHGITTPWSRNTQYSTTPDTAPMFMNTR